MVKSRIVKKLTGRRFSVDRRLGYPVFRAWDPTDPSEVVKRFKPDLAVIRAPGSVPMAVEMDRLGVLAIIYLHTLQAEALGGHPISVPNARFMTCSNFAARWYHEKFGIDPVVVPPYLDAERYRVDSTREYVTFINPHPWKGFEIAAEVARACPDIPFLFVESWRLPDAIRDDVLSTIAKLANVTLMPPTRNMRQVYARTRVLLVPSQWQESWGRVASEAHVSGIPVVGSRRGGLPEAIGEGGVVIEHDAPIAKWSDAVRRLWHDDAEYSRLSQAALDYAQRPDLDPDRQIETYLAVANEAGSNRSDPDAFPAGRALVTTRLHAS